MILWHNFHIFVIYPHVFSFIDFINNIFWYKFLTKKVLHQILKNDEWLFIGYIAV